MSELLHGVLDASDLERLRDRFASVAKVGQPPRLASPPSPACITCSRSPAPPPTIKQQNLKADGTGDIDKKAFAKLIKSMVKEDGEKPPADKDLTKAFQLADVDKSGTVDWDEFTTLYAKVKRGEVRTTPGPVIPRPDSLVVDKWTPVEASALPTTTTTRLHDPDRSRDTGQWARRQEPLLPCASEGRKESRGDQAFDRGEAGRQRASQGPCGPS